MKPIVNPQGQVTGYLNTTSSGDTQLLSKSGQVLGWYCPKRDQTFKSPFSQMIGFGNQLMMLLR
ncbi:MAG: hypothetical protein V2I33_12370 [Kangiellaceae bacterium]|jgi:hypothetical protein|nr:hypothetical protein [Kangiellaceae bacterium]